MNDRTQRVVHPVDMKGVDIAEVPFMIDIEPDAAVPVGTMVEVLHQTGVRDFVCTGIGFTSEAVGFPAAGMQFKIAVTDIGSSTPFQPHRWNITRMTGSNPGISDAKAFELPVEWLFKARTTIAIQFENLGAHDCLPGILLIGFLSNMGR